MEPKRIILEGITVDELVEEITKAVLESLKQIGNPIPQIREKPISHRKGAMMIGCDVRTFNKILKRNNIPRVTANVIEAIRKSELK